MRVYIIHSPSTSENYIDNVLSVEQKLIENGDHVMNPLPDQVKGVGNKELYEMYGHKIKDCDKVYVMKGWAKTCTGNPEMAEALKHSKDIVEVSCITYHALIMVWAFQRIDAAAIKKPKPGDPAYFVMVDHVEQKVFLEIIKIEDIATKELKVRDDWFDIESEDIFFQEKDAEDFAEHYVKLHGYPIVKNDLFTKENENGD